MIYISIVLFAVAAILGLSILIRWLGKKNASRAVIYSHGVVAATALVLLIVYALQHPDNFPKVSILLFVIVAIAGFYMFFLDLQKKPHPLLVAFVHALVAVISFVLLLLFAFV